MEDDLDDLEAQAKGVADEDEVKFSRPGSGNRKLATVLEMEDVERDLVFDAGDGGADREKRGRRSSR